jgi:hypothetical protein
MSATDVESTQTDEEKQDDERGPTASEFRALKDRLAEVEAENDRLRERVDDLEQRTENIENGKDYAHDRIDECDNRLDDATDQRKNLFSRVHNLETGFDSEKAAPESGPLGSETATATGTDTCSPLAQLTNLSEHVADEHLTANQQRARFVAKDIRDYADKTPKGLVVDSAAISRVLSVRDGEPPHTETVSRVMEFLDQLGKNETETKLHKGRRIAVFDDEATHRYGAGSVNPSHCDVIDARARG